LNFLLTSRIGQHGIHSVESDWPETSSLAKKKIGFFESGVNLNLAPTAGGRAQNRVRDRVHPHVLRGILNASKLGSRARATEGRFSEAMGV
jgi:hypothetical protein